MYITSQAFDTVPHTRLLRKLDHCGVRGNIHGWLESWLTTREQKVLVDGEKSRSVKVFPEESGVRHGVKSLVEIKDEHIHLLLVIQVSADFFDCDY
jgi:hypothetical protein